MKRNIVTVKTVTIGLKGKKVLSAHGIKANIVKIDSTKAENGCQYGLEFNESALYDVVAILREHGIDYGVYEPK